MNREEAEGLRAVQNAERAAIQARWQYEADVVLSAFRSSDAWTLRLNEAAHPVVTIGASCDGPSTIGIGRSFMSTHTANEAERKFLEKFGGPGLASGDRFELRELSITDSAACLAFSIVVGGFRLHGEDALEEQLPVAHAFFAAHGLGAKFLQAVRTYAARHGEYQIAEANKKIAALRGDIAELIKQRALMLAALESLELLGASELSASAEQAVEKS